MKKIFCALALFLAPNVWAATATDGSSGLTLSIQQAVDMALSDNPTVKIAELEVKRYDYVRRTTMGALLPQVSVDGTLNRTVKTQDMARGFSFSSDPYNTITATGNVSLQLFAPSVYRTLRMNEEEALHAVESARSSRIELIAAVKNSFYQVLLAERSLEVLEESAETSLQTVNETQVKFDNGLSSEYDLLTAQVQYSNLQPSIMQSRSSIEIAKNVLKMYLSLPLNIAVEVSGDLDTFREEVLNNSYDLPQDISGNSSIKSLVISENILSQQLRINNASRLPTLSAYGSLSYTGNDMVSSFSMTEGTTASTDRYFWQSPANVGLSLSIPIFAGLTTSNRSRQIENQIELLELQRQYAVESVSVSLSTAINNIHTAREQLFAQVTTVSQAQKAYSISNTRYVAGAGTILELNTSRLTLTQAELSLSEAIYNLLAAKSEYNRIAGLESVK